MHNDPVIEVQELKIGKHRRTPLSLPQALMCLCGGRTTKSILMLGGGNILAHAISLLAMPVASRLYSPADFGCAAVYAAMTGLVVLVACGRYEMAIPLPKNRHTGLSLVVLCLGLATATAVCAAAFLWFQGSKVLVWFASESALPYLWILPPAVLGASAYQILTQWNIRERAYARIAATKFTQVASEVAVMLGIGFTMAGPLGLLLADLAKRGTGVLSLSRPLWREYGELQAKKTMRECLETAKHYRRFPLLSAPSALLNATGLLVPPLILARLYGTEISGVFSLSQRVLLIPMALAGTAVSQVFVGEAAKLLHERPSQLPELFRSVVLRMALLGLPLLVLAPAFPTLFYVCFGAQWRQAGTFATILSVPTVLQLAVSPISGVSFLTQRQDIQLRLDALRALAVVAGFYVPFLLQLPPVAAITCFAGLMSLTHCISLAAYRNIVYQAMPHDEDQSGGGRQQRGQTSSM